VGAVVPEQLVIEPLEEGSGLRVAGELDLLTVPQVRDALARVNDRAPNVVLELGGVTFVDSSGLGLLISTANAAQTRGGSLIIRSPSRTLLRLFGIAIPDGIPGLVVEPDVYSA
jgi:anti-sigma B factor antagonist